MSNNISEQEIVDALKMLDIQTSADEEGNIEFNVEVSDEFEVWFKESQGLKKWSEKRFTQWFKSLMSEKLPKVHAAMLMRREPGDAYIDEDS